MIETEKFFEMNFRIFKEFKYTSEEIDEYITSFLM
jgi:hypothetical protein